jgi:hypothetical protein
MTPEELAKRLTPEYQAMRQMLMQRIVLVVQANIQRRTRVRSGNLRRSWTSRVERSGERGVVGTSVVYAPFQRNQPAEEGLEDSLTTIQQLAKDAGEELFTRVSR